MCCHAINRHNYFDMNSLLVLGHPILDRKVVSTPWACPSGPQVWYIFTKTPSITRVTLTSWSYLAIMIPRTTSAKYLTKYKRQESQNKTENFYICQFAKFEFAQELPIRTQCLDSSNWSNLPRSNPTFITRPSFCVTLCCISLVLFVGIAGRAGQTELWPWQLVIIACLQTRYSFGKKEKIENFLT